MREGLGRDRAILRLAVPALATLAVDPLVSLIDTAFVGRLGTEELAALAIAVAIFGVAFFLFNFLAYGTTPLVAQATGAGDRRRASEVVIQALGVAGLLGIALFVAVQVAAAPLVRVMGAGEVTDPALAYLRLRAFALPAVLLITAAHGAFRGYQDTTTPLRVTLGLNVLNLVLDPLLIFVLGWGLEGAAAATVIAQWVGALWFLDLILRRRREELHISIRWPDLGSLPRFLRAGGQLIVRTAALLGVYTLATAVAARVGTVELAAHQIASQLWLFLALSVDALAISAQALVGAAVGGADTREVRLVARRLTQLGLIAGLVLGGAVWLGRVPVAGWFTTAPATAEVAAVLLGFVAILQPISGLVFVWDGVFIGAGRFRFLAVTTVAASVLSAGLLLLVPVVGWGVEGVWLAIAGMMIARLVLVGARYRPLVRTPPA
ncbi:MAG: MATE family efflux transporter [Acidimicrobiia bacterium]